MQIAVTNQILGGRYKLLDEIGAGGMGAVFRSVDRLTGQRVAVKRVHAPDTTIQLSTPADSVDVRLALAQEFRTLASLRHPNIISVLDYGFDELRQPYIVMELLEDSQTILAAARGLTATELVRLLVQVLQALIYLHRFGVIHRDLKPANVLVRDGQVKVLDFGLALVAGEMKATTEQISGTLAYLAPEVLAGGKVTESVDLYAVGLIAYELLTGRHPFDTDSMSHLMQQIAEVAPDVRGAGIDDKLAPVIERLLAKSPTGRYANPAEVIIALSEAVGQPLPMETVSTRESFLQASRFIGRTAELSQLVGVLVKAIGGQGNAWLIGGESGVGKSRLLDEVRSQALVRGALVLRGQAVSEGGSLYQLWREILQRLALTVDLSDLEAGVLKMLVPGIPALLGRPVVDVPELDAQAMQKRMFTVIENIFRRQQQPVVLILEDLHWATESLDLLLRLARIVGELPLLVIGSFRNDERPDLPALLPALQLMTLDRLSGEHVAELSESMLGLTGRRADVVGLLQRETEGNVFFLVEVVRALAEEAGQLDQIGATTLPEHVFAGGVQRILKRRLDHVPDEARPLLRTAAVAGRSLDLNVLQLAAPDVNLDQYLAACAAVPVLDVQDGRWRFSHDKLREALLASLSEAERRALHKRVAGAIETAYPGLPEHFAALAYHWKMAGVALKAADYLGKAGTEALRICASKDAVTFFTEALVLEPSADSESAQFRIARLEEGLGRANLSLGHLAESRLHLEKALVLFGKLGPRSGPGLILALLQQVVGQVTRRLRNARLVERTGSKRDTLLAAADIYFGLSNVYYFDSNLPLATDAALRSLNLGESAGRSAKLARYYINGCILAGFVPLRSLAETYIRLAYDCAESAGDLSALAYVQEVSAVYRLDMGQWNLAQQAMSKALDNYTQLGDERWRRECLFSQGFLAYHQGRFADGQKWFSEAYNSAIHSDDVQHRPWSLMGQGQSMLRLGQPDRAQVLLEAALAACHDPELRLQALINSLLSVAYLHGAKPDLAQLTADATVTVISKIKSLSSYMLEAYAGVAEVYLSLWEASQNNEPAEVKGLATKAQIACKYLLQYKRLFPSSAPRAFLWQGLYWSLEGQPTQARKSWQAGLAEAKRLGMPFEQGLLLFEVGRHLGDADPQRKADLTRAADLFRQTGAAWELERAEEHFG